MQLLWDHFSEEDFRRMKKRIVASANDDAMTFEPAGYISAGNIRIELCISEEADERFSLQWQYLVGCADPAAADALSDIQTDGSGFFCGTYPVPPQRLAYREDIRYPELKEAIEAAFEKTVREDTSGLLRIAAEQPACFWPRALTAEADPIAAGAAPDEKPLEQQILALAELPAEAFKTAVLSLARGV